MKLILLHPEHRSFLATGQLVTTHQAEIMANFQQKGTVALLRMGMPGVKLRSFITYPILLLIGALFFCGGIIGFYQALSRPHIVSFLITACFIFMGYNFLRLFFYTSRALFFTYPAIAYWLIRKYGKLRQGLIVGVNLNAHAQEDYVEILYQFDPPAPKVRTYKYIIHSPFDMENVGNQVYVLSWRGRINILL